MALRANLAGDLRGGLSTAAVTLGILLPLGLLSFASLGADAAGIGIRAALVSAIVGGGVVVMIGGGLVPGSGPKTSTTLIFAALVATLAADARLRVAGTVDVQSIVVLTSSCVAMAGVLQVTFALLRLGSVVTFVPLPVVAGFMDGVAVLTIVAQFRVLLGVPDAPFAVPAIGMATAVAAWVMARRVPGAPWALLGIVFGTALHWALAGLSGASFGPLLGAPAADVPTPFLAMGTSGLAPRFVAHLPQLLTTAIVIALIGTLDGLLSAAGVDARLHTRHDPNRLLLGQGLGNVACAAFGGLPVVNLPSAQIAGHRAGGRSRACGIVCVLALLLVMIAARWTIAKVPVAVTAGVMMIIGLGLFDQWSRTVWHQVRAGARDRDALWALATVAIVCIVTVFFGFVVGIAVGVALSIALFVAALNRSLVRGVTTGETRGSRRIYVPDQDRVLRERGASVRLVELEGAIFFGNAHRFEREIEELIAGVRFPILDTRRVTMIDASGAAAFERLASRVRTRDAQLVLAGLAMGDRNARALRAHGAFARSQDRHWYPDADRALEYAERRLLEEAGQRASEEELPLARLSLLQGMDAAQRAAFAAYLSRVELAAHEVLFRKGEPGDYLYALAKGSISILADIDDDFASAHRLASFAPGVVFGETAMLDGGGRTASGVADEPSVVYLLTRAGLDTIREREPELAHIVLLNIACQLSARLRFATATIQASER